MRGRYERPGRLCLDSGRKVRLHFAPWRPDPRPLDSLLQGAYAFFEVSAL
ncbi:MULTISPECIES: aKG-HExxH-type peptide beta-hydroxylase [unclassified Streptomyces]|nr:MULTISPECIES: HEXXH motif-containing putative peptide modification protein [unclassified Streptomyces]TXS81018.1 hypothetical protein EAO69_00660 [Streptomyces sp. me109]